MANDPDYRANQRHCQRIWRRRNVDYWREYRSTHREYRQRNRVLQRHRDNKRRRLGELAKMDTSQAVSFVNPGIYYLIPEPGPSLAKMDALAQKFHVIPAR
jgi:hypothetical protein